MRHYLFKKMNRLLPLVALAMPSAAPVSWGQEFRISPKDDVAVIGLQPFRPYSMPLDQTIKPLVYAAITD
jgi:hypothetical protein